MIDVAILNNLVVLFVDLLGMMIDEGHVCLSHHTIGWASLLSDLG